MMRHANHRPPDIRRITAVLLLAVLTSCQPDATTAPTVTEASFARGGNGGGGPGPKVDAANPPSAPQDITLDVRVLGSGFDEGSVATWTIDGVAQAEVRTNATTFVSQEELVANITIEESALVELYDIEVTTSRGKKGIGADLFSVVKKGTPTFTVVELEPIEGSDRSFAKGMNDNGGIVGSSWSRWDAFDKATRWTVDASDLSVTVTPLQMLPGWQYASALDVTSAGLSAGVFAEQGTTAQKPTVWGSDGSSLVLESSEDVWAQANAVSSFGTGWIAAGREDRDAVYWESGAPPISPVILPPVQPGVLSRANAVNSMGTIAGLSGGNAVVWYRNTDGSYGAPCVLESDAVAHGIAEPSSSSTYVAGAWSLADPVGAVWLVDAGCSTVTRHLEQSSELYDVSSTGDAVGEGWTAADHAILWTNDGQVFGLPGLTNAQSGAVRATAITSDGQWIVGLSAAEKHGSRGVLWIRH